MEDNYYKKGKEVASHPQKSCAQEPRASAFANKGRAKGAIGSSQQHLAGSSAAGAGRQSAGGALKTNFNDLGKGRIVESSQSGFAIQTQLQPKQANAKHHQAASESWHPGQNVANDADQTVRAMHPAASGPSQPGQEMSANSTGQQRRSARHSHDHFATLHQTPQPVMISAQPGTASSGNGGSSTPLTHLIPRRQFEMTQLPKSNSAVSAGAEKTFMSQHQQALTMHLQNPKITSQTVQRLGDATGPSSSKKRLEAVVADRNTSSLSNGAKPGKHAHAQLSHSRKSSSQLTTKPSGSALATKPQGGVFQSGPDQLKNHQILTQNFIVRTPHTANELSQPAPATGSSHQEMPLLAQQLQQDQSNPRGSLGAVGRASDQLKSGGFTLEPHRASANLNKQHPNFLSAQKTATQGSFSNQQLSLGGSALAQLTLNQQNSAGAPAAGSIQASSHFNTPSNCYQATQQQNLQNLQYAGTADPNALALGQNVGAARHSHPTKEPLLQLQQHVHLANMLPHQHNTEGSSHLNHLSQNSYELTAPLHNISSSQTPVGMNARQASNASLIGNTHQHSNSTLIASMAQQAQNTSAQNIGPQNMHQTTANNHSQVVNFTQHTQQAHPNLQMAVQLHQQAPGSAAQPANTDGAAGTNQQSQITSHANKGAQGHLSASQFDISALLRQQPSSQAPQAVLDFQDLCSNTTQQNLAHQTTQAALKTSIEATGRDIDFLKQRFYAEHGCDTNDILTLYSYWQSNFQSFAQPTDNGNQTTAINGLQIANISSYKHNQQQLTIAAGSGLMNNGGSKSNNVTTNFALGKSIRASQSNKPNMLSNSTNQQHLHLPHNHQHHQSTINFNSQSFENQTMTTSHIQARKTSKTTLLEQTATTGAGGALGPGVVPGNFVVEGKMLNAAGAAQQHHQQMLGLAPAGQDSTEIQHFTTTSVGAGYPPFDANQQMFFIASNPGPHVPDLHQVKGRRTQPCLRQHSTVSNRQNCTDTVSFHRDVPTPMMHREQHASIEVLEDEKNEFSFEEPAFDGTNEHSIEEEEKSLINALSFKKQIAPLQDGQHLHEIENQRRWATAKQDATPSLPKHNRNTTATRPLSKDHCGFTIQLSPINRFAPSPRSKKSIFDFHGLKYGSLGGSMLQNGMLCAKERIQKRGSTAKDGERKYFHRSLSTQTKALSILTRQGGNSSNQGTQVLASLSNPLFRLKNALDILLLQGGAQLTQMDLFRKIVPKRSKDFDSNDNRTVTGRDTIRGANERNHSDVKRRRDKSTKGRGTSKSRKRQGSRNSRKARLASLYRESTSSIGEESASIPIFTHVSKDGVATQQAGIHPGSQINIASGKSKPGYEPVVVQDAETTQDIQKLCREIEAAEKNFSDKLNEDENQFDKQVTRQVIQAERALQESKRESQTREQSLRATRRESQMSIAERASNIKAQSLSSLNQAMNFTPGVTANATQRHLNPSELYGTKGPGKLNLQTQQMNEPVLAAPNTERPNAHSIELRIAQHNQKQNQKKRGGATIATAPNLADQSNTETETTQRPLVKVQQQSKKGGAQAAANGGNKRIAMVQLLDQKSEPCLLKPKKLSLDRQNVRLFAGEAGKAAMSAQKDSDGLPLEANTAEHSDERLTNERKIGAQSLLPASSQPAGLQSTSSMKRKLTFIKTKNINFHSVSKLSGRMQPSATATHQGAPAGLRIKLQKTTNGDSSDRSGPEMRFQAQNTCQSALASHKNAGKDLATRFLAAKKSQPNSGQSSNAKLLKNANQMHEMAQHKSHATEQSDSGVTPSKPSGKIKYASARIKLLRVDHSQEKGHNKTEGSIGVHYQHKLHEPQTTSHVHDGGAAGGSPTSSQTSLLGGIPHIRRLVEMLINEYYRKRGESIKTVTRAKQVDTLVDFWWQSLSHQKILCKLKGKLSKTGLVEKEKHLLNFLNGKDTQSLLQLQKHSTTRKYGELAVLQEPHLRLALEDYLSKSQ